MSLSINQNIMAMNSYRNLSNTQNSLAKSLEKLSSGFRINRAADDAAGLAISEGMRSQVNGNRQAQRNAQDGISLVQTTEGALEAVHNILQRARTLTVQGANDSNNEKARANINAELKQLSSELTRISKVTEFNGLKTLGGEKELKFQVGANGTQDDVISVTTFDLATEVGDAITFMGTGGTDHAGFNGKIAVLDAAIGAVSTRRSDLGAVQNRFEHTIKNLGVAVENLSASESRIRDTDMASEMMQFTRNQILSQAGTSMLAQANQVPQGVLSLLR